MVNVIAMVVPRGTRLRAGYAEHAVRRPMGAGLDLWARRRDGSEFPAEISLSSITVEGRMVVAAAVRDGNPVIYLEAKGLYSFFRTDLREAVPVGADFEVEIGKAAVRREGKAALRSQY